MRVIIMLAVLVPSAIIIALMVRSNYQARHVRNAQERKRLETEIELTRQSIENEDLADDLLVTQETLAEKRKRHARRAAHDDGGGRVVHLRTGGDDGADDPGAGPGE